VEHLTVDMGWKVRTALAGVLVISMYMLKGQVSGTAATVHPPPHTQMRAHIQELLLHTC
jgi:hypothetical protein